MALQSQLLSGDKALENAAISDADHIVPGARGPHVAKIQQALITLTGAAIKADGIYGPATAAAVADFKRKQQPPILNFEGKIDNIVGIKTMAALDAQLPKRGPFRLAFGVDPITFVDVVVNFKGAAGQRPLDPEEALPRRLLQSDFGSVEDPLNRKLLRRKSDDGLLLRIAHATNAFGAEGAFALSRVLLAVKVFLTVEKDPELDREMLVDRIFIYGTSSGGRNALEFVSLLRQSGLRPHFVAPIDASFFQSDTADRPKSSKEPADPVPTFKLNRVLGPLAASQVIGVPNRHNFFQRRGNHVKTIVNPFAREDLFSLAYTSRMGGNLEEIHGNVEFFQPHEVEVAGPSDDDFHEQCDAEGRFQVQAMIAKELREG